MVPRRARCITLVLSSPLVCPSTRCTICWSVHQYQKPMIDAPRNTTYPGNCGYIGSAGSVWNMCVVPKPSCAALQTAIICSHPSAMLPLPSMLNPRNSTRNEPIIRIGVCMAERVITPFIPPNTVNTAVMAIRPMAPYQNGSPSRYSKNMPPVNAVTDTLVSTYAMSVIIDSQEPVRCV